MPILGYLWDSRLHQLRPLLGTAGASAIGSPIETPEPLAAAAIGKQQNLAVVLTGETRAAGLLRFQSPATLQALRGVRPGAARIELSPEGSAAAFYFPDGRLVQVVSGLPDRPSDPVDISLIPLRNPLASFTVSDDGAIILCAEAPGDVNSGVPAAVVLSAAGDLNRIVLGGAVTAAAFLEGTHDLLLASGRELVLVRDAIAGLRIALGNSGVAPTFIAFAPGGGRAVLADGRTGLVAVLNLEAETETPVVMECHCRPTGLFRLNGEATWRLNDYSRGALRLIDLKERDVQVLTVPPSSAESR